MGRQIPSTASDLTRGFFPPKKDSNDPRKDFTVTEPTIPLKDLLTAAQAWTVKGLKNLRATDAECAEAVATVEASLVAGSATLEVRIDLEGCTAELWVHHASAGPVRLFSAVPGPSQGPSH